MNGIQRAAFTEMYGVCPIEAGVVGSLADHECEHGRMPEDLTPDCGCWTGRRPLAVTLAEAEELATQGATYDASREAELERSEARWLARTAMRGSPSGPEAPVSFTTTGEVSAT